MARNRIRSLFFVLPLLLILAGCYLVSGERVETVPLEGDGEGTLLVEFVSADGRTRREFLTGQLVVDLSVVVTATTEWGELRLEILDADLSTALVVESRYGLAGAGQTVIKTDGAGRINYRVIAQEVRKGAYSLRYQVAETPPTPTPTPEPTPSP